MNVMNFFLKEVQVGLDVVCKCDLKCKMCMCVWVGDEVYLLLWFEDNGFLFDSVNVLYLCGLVDFYDGLKYFYQCLIVVLQEEDGEMLYEFKCVIVVED